MPRDLPSGTVTFLFTDVEGSTRLLKQLRDDYAGVLATHRQLLRAAFAEQGGREIDTQGDAFFFAFARARDAVAAAADGQRALVAHDWPAGVELRVRMGLHTGEPVVGDEGYTGLGVHRAARICSAGHGGQVLLSNASRELVEDELPEGVQLRDLGEHRLKDLERAERIFELRIEGVSQEFPSLKTIEAQPSEATPFAGREEELAVAAEAAVRPIHRRRASVVLAGVASLVVVALGAYLLADRSGGQALTGVEENAVGVISADSRKIDRQIPVGANPGQIAAGEDAIWVTNSDEGTVSRIDSETGSVRQTIRVGSAPSGIAAGREAVWVANTLDRMVARIDPETNEVV